MASDTGFLAKFQSVTFQLKGIALLVVVTLCFIGFKGLSGMNNAANSLEDLYSQGMQHTIRAGKILDKLGDARSNLLLAQQHDPTSEVASLHDHPISVHFDEITTALTSLHHIVDNEILVSDISGEERALVNQMVDVLDVITDDGFMPAMEYLKNNQFSDANLLLLKTINPEFKTLSQQAERFLALQTEEGEANYNEAVDNADRFMWTVGGVIALSVIVLFGLFAKIVFRMNNAITEIESTSTSINKGDLTRRVNVSGDDEFAHIADSVNTLVANFQSLVKDTQHSTGLLANSASESAVVTNQTQRNVLDQQAQTQMIAAAIHEFTATVHEVANNTSSAATASQEADNAASDGQKIVMRSIEMIEHLSRDLESTVDAMNQLQKHTEAIGSVVVTIQGISEQTNLLA